MPKLSPTQQSLIDAMQAAPEKKLIRHNGGFWCLGSYLCYPDVHWGTNTVMNLAKRGLIKATEESKGRYWNDYVLTTQPTQEN